jgi:hypothetical protein
MFWARNRRKVEDAGAKMELSMIMPSMMMALIMMVLMMMTSMMMLSMMTSMMLVSMERSNEDMTCDGDETCGR